MLVVIKAHRGKECFVQGKEENKTKLSVWDREVTSFTVPVQGK